MKPNELLAGVARRRLRLSEEMLQVERAASAPVAMESWAVELTVRLRELAGAFSDHTEEVQSPDGLLDQVVDKAPWLEDLVGAVRIEHTRIAKSISTAVARGESGGSQDLLSGLRDSVIDVLVGIARHRQHEADLIYKAYDVDIGGQD